VDLLKTALTTAAASIVNDIDRLDCLSSIDDWYNARVAVAALQSSDIASYSIAGRTVTRKQLPNLEQTERMLYARIHAYLYHRGMGLVDVRDPVGLEGSSS